MAGRSRVASLDLPNGTSNTLIHQSSNPVVRDPLGPQESLPEPFFPSVDSTTSLNKGTHIQPFNQGRSRPNVPLGAAGANPTYLNSTQRWNPSALLNPKGFQKAQQRETRSENTGFQYDSTPQPSFEFDSPGGSTSSTPPYYAHTPIHNAQGSNYANNLAQGTGEGMGMGTGTGTGTGLGMGMGHMVERMHNVAERDFHPQKRRKIGEENDASEKAKFSGGGNGGIFGEYIKEKQEEGRHEATVNGTMSSVDLTGVEDQDLLVVPNVDDKEVCYGRIEGADINASKVPTPKPGTVALSDGYWPQIKIILKRRVGDKTKIIHVVDSTRMVIGTLDVNTAIGLVPILDSRLGVRTSARILTRPKKSEDLPPGSDVSCRYNLDLTLYGPRKYAQQIGRHLSQKQLWLRTPLFVEAGIELHNPHATQTVANISKPGGRYGAGYGTNSGPQMRTVEEIRSDVIGMFDSLEKSENLPEMEPDPRVLTNLLRHQKQGLYFMTNKEKERVFGENEADNNSLWRLRIGNNGEKSYYNVITGQEERRNPPQVLGGILADMMGLGKTLSILSLIIGSLEESKNWAKKSPPPPQNKESVALQQNCKTTLLVSPLSTIANWEEQITQHIKPDTLKYHIYHGPSRIKDLKKLAEFDLVITTYGSVASEFNKRQKGGKGDHPLETLHWFRIVLDEAHMIREQATLQSKAICSLEAQRRWAVTGTPVQNRLDDLGALIKFLRIKPFDDKRGFSQFILGPCKSADPEILPKLRLLVDSITLRRLKDKIDLPKRTDKIVRLEFSPEERELYNIFAKNASDRVKVLTSQKEKSLGGRAYVHILQSILRLRLICAHGKELLSDEDMEILAGVSKSSAIDLDSDNDEDKPALTSKQAYDMFNLMRETNADLCALCYGKIGPSEMADADGESKEVIAHMTPCFHLLCHGCIKEYKKTAEQNSQDQRYTTCPVCNQYIRMSFFGLKQGKVEEDESSQPGIKDNIKRVKELGRYGGPHTKTRALIEDLLASKAESELNSHESPIKSVIFSGWTSHLDLIQISLEDNQISYTRLDGKMSRSARTAALETFRTDSSVHVILVSIMAGGLGLNLTSGNKVYVMEPQYNPAAEAQAVDRVHRLGQKREVETVRYVIEDSFEEKMLELQEKKKRLASLSMDREGGRSALNKTEATRRRLEELRSLFK